MISSLHIDTARTWRGGQNQALVTAAGLQRLGHPVALVAHPAGVLRVRAEGLLDVIPLAPRHELDVAAAWRLARVIARLRPAIVHAHDPHGVAMAALALSAARRRPKLVAARRVDFRLRGNALSRWKYRQVDLFICASDAIRRLLLADRIPPERALTVHEGIDVARVDAAAAARLHEDLGLPAGAPIVGNVAALVEHKGQRYLIDAAAEVVRRRPDARFVIAGDGELRGALERQIQERRLQQEVVLAGFRPDVLSMHRAFDVFVMSSVTEGLGTSLLDAMACGKPIVATRAGGMPEVVVDGSTGILVDPRDSRGLARAVLRLLADDRLRARMGAAGRTRLQERFSAEVMVGETVRAYERLLR